MPTKAQKGDPEWVWNQTDEEFFAHGACHILAYTYLKKNPDEDLTMVYIRPKGGAPGHHVYIRRGEWSFDFRGWCLEERMLTAHYKGFDLDHTTADLIPVHQHLEEFCAWSNHRPPSYFLELPWRRALHFIQKHDLSKPEEG